MEETLEEAAEIYASHSLKEERQKDLNMGFKEGAKWQQERMFEIMKAYADDVVCGYSLRAKEWFQQFKTK